MAFITNAVYFISGFSWTTSVIIVVLCVLVQRYFFSRKPWRYPLPPSPSRRLPVLGHLLQMSVDMAKPLRKFRKELGDVYSVYLGGNLVVVLGGYDTIKQAFQKEGETFEDRPKTYVMEKVTKGYGIASTNGPLWLDHRRFTMTVLKDFGMVNGVLERKIREEVDTFLEAIEGKGAQAFDPRDIISKSVDNIICKFSFGDAYTDDHRYLRMTALAEENLSFSAFTGLVQLFPILAWLPGDLCHVEKMVNNSNESTELAREIINEHLERFDEDNIDDFTSAYIKEMKKIERTNTQDSTTFSYDQLIAIYGDLRVAGSLSTVGSLRWSMAFLANYPDIQERLYTEIDEYVGTERRPSAQDRSRLTYLQAFYMEILRVCNISVTGSVHATSRDTEFKGYTLPAGTTIMADLGSVLEDETIWGDPGVFRPDRFIDEAGKLRKPEEFIPFGIGRRICIGDNLVKMELLLFLGALIQRFRLECPPEEDLTMAVIDGEFGLAHSPKPFKIIMRSRTR